MANTGNFASLLEPGLRKIYGESYRQYPREYTKVFSLDTSTRAFEEDQGITGLGTVPEKAEGKSISYDDPLEGYLKRYTHTTYGLGFMVTREMFEDDQYRKMRAMPKALGRSVRQTIEVLGANHFNRAFNSSYTGSDGVEMCSAVHPLVGGGTFANELSTPADLDITSYEQALIDIQAYVDDRGLKMLCRPQKLVVHPDNLFQAQIILKSEQLPDTANNDINPAAGTMNGGIVVMHWLTDPDAWFITTDCPNGLNWLWRRKPEFTRDNDWETENAKFKTTFRASSGWTDPRGVFGSPGA